MKVKCLYNTGKVLPEVYRENKYDTDSEFQLTIGKEYVVYGIVTIKKYNWFLICEDNYDGIYIYYPLYRPCHLFTITDGRISKYWIAKERIDDYDKGEKGIHFGFKELVEEEYFNGNLVEGYKREVEIFQNYKKRIDSEFD